MADLPGESSLFLNPSHSQCIQTYYFINGFDTGEGTAIYWQVLYKNQGGSTNHHFRPMPGTRILMGPSWIYTPGFKTECSLPKFLGYRTQQEHKYLLWFHWSLKNRTFLPKLKQVTENTDYMIFPANDDWSSMNQSSSMPNVINHPYIWATGHLSGVKMRESTLLQKRRPLLGLQAGLCPKFRE